MSYTLSTSLDTVVNTLVSLTRLSDACRSRTHLMDLFPQNLTQCLAFDVQFSECLNMRFPLLARVGVSLIDQLLWGSLKGPTVYIF
jgi:adenylate kinase family enzyme